MHLLSVTDLSKSFGATVVLANVDFTIREGEVLGLIGPNGSGKTTLFECVAGLIPADSGTIEYRGAGIAVRDRKRVLFYLPDMIRPWPDQSVRWILRFFESQFGRTSAECLELAEALNLSGVLKSRVASLSKGELKRLLLALALLTSQPLLLLDEPFDGLDFRQTRDVMALLGTYPAKGRTLFLSIHQLTDAARVCDRLILLSRGRVAGAGTLPELQARAGLSDGGIEDVFLALT